MANVREQIGLGFDGVSPKYSHWIGLEVNNDFETGNESIVVKYATYTEVNGEKLQVRKYQYVCRDGEVLRTLYNKGVIADTDANGTMLTEIVEGVERPKERVSEFTKNINFFTNPIWNPIISTMIKKHQELIAYQPEI